MVWYEKLIFVVVVLLAVAAVFDIFRSIGPDLPYGILAAVLGIIGTVLIRERRKRES